MLFKITFLSHTVLKEVQINIFCLQLYLRAVRLEGLDAHLCGDGDIAEALLVPEVLEGGDHVRLEVVPAEAELLVVGHGDFGWRVLCNRSHLRTIITLWTRN